MSIPLFNRAYFAVLLPISFSNFFSLCFLRKKYHRKWAKD